MPAIPLFFLYGWQTYSWAKYGPTYSPSQFVASAVTSPGKQSAIGGATLLNQGAWAMLWGVHATNPDARVPPRQVAASTADTALMAGMQPVTAYTARPVCSNVVPNTPTGLPLSGSYYGDPISFSTTP